MAQSVNHYAALCLADLCIMRRTQIAGRNFFSPGDTVSRREYLAMLMQAAGSDSGIPVISATGLAEDDDIPLWLKSYVAAVMASGIVSGHGGEDGPQFDAASPITVAEAAVIMANVMGLYSGFDSFGDAPAWVVDEVAAMAKAGLIKDCSYTAALTRDAAVGILFGVSRAMQG